MFDRVGTGAGTRVAFFSSWPELGGLTVLVLLTALLLQALAGHLLLLRGIESNLPAWCWTPLVGLAVLAIPFLPWIADRLRVLDALAGPGRWWVWAVAGGQGAVAHQDGRHATMAPPWLEPGRRRFTEQVLVFGVSAAIFARPPGGSRRARSTRRRRAALSRRHAEPAHRSHDLAIANNYARGDYLAYYQAPLKPRLPRHWPQRRDPLDSPGRHLRADRAGLRALGLSRRQPVPCACSPPRRSR